MAAHARRASTTVASRFISTNAPMPTDAQRGTNVLRRLSLSSGTFTKVTALFILLKKTLNITFSPHPHHLTQLLDHLQVLHQIRLLVQHPIQLLVRLLLSRINPIALQLLALMEGSRAGLLLLWENASLKATSMVSINLALLFPSRLFGVVTARASSLFF